LAIVIIIIMPEPINESNKKIYFEWLDFEYEINNKSSDWFWIVGAIASLIILLSVIFANFLLAIIILIGVGTIMVYANREPELIHFILTNKGFQIKNEFYSLTNIDSFAINDDPNDPKMIIETDRLLFPKVIIPLGNIDPELIQEALIPLIPEIEYEESTLDRISERLGF